jgi:diguanylate cyclase (GGDEF)-like protein/PAS domain S-box-containing protein
VTPTPFDAEGSIFKAIVDHAIGPMLVADAAGRLVFTNEAFRLLVSAEASGSGRSLLELVHPEDALAVEQIVALPPRVSGQVVQARLRAHAGQWTDAELSITDLRDDHAVQGLVITVRDGTHRRLADEALIHTALHDPLTGLPNRALLLDRLGQALARSDRRVTHTAVLFLDLDNFKVINDSLGHLAGDLLLIEIAHRLMANVRAGDTVARFGGDEFAVLLEDVADANDALLNAERLLDAVRERLQLDGREVLPEVSIGVALSGNRGEQPEDVLRKADLAMYQAKAAGKGRCCAFEPAMQTRADARLELETGLRDALELGHLRVHFQPILSLANGQISGFEALVRWERPGYGLVTPVEFVPVAEETGLIVPLGQWVLAESCRHLRDWQSKFPDNERLGISVNVSPRQLRHPALVTDVIRTIDQTGVDPTCVTLEITESALIENAEDTTRVLHQLKAVGVQLAIDDFGTGYSSLNYLRRLPVDILKIDRSFVNGLADSDRDEAVVQGILDLAGTLQLTTTAEGIETETQLATVRRMGGSSGQGFFFARPLTPDAVEALLEANRGPFSLAA